MTISAEMLQEAKGLAVTAWSSQWQEDDFIKLARLIIEEMYLNETECGGFMYGVDVAHNESGLLASE